MMDKEYREMKIAQYKHDALLEHMKSSQDEIANITELLTQYENVDANYNTLLNAKRNWLSQNGIMVVENYESSIRNFESRQKEIDEALSACRKLIASLSSARDDLASAKGWGMFETLGDGLISDNVKQDQLKRVSQYILDSSEKAKRLTSELSDLKPYFDFEIVEIDALSKTYDIFFDQIFLDSAIQQQIEEAHLKICKNQALAESVLKKLEALSSDTMNNLGTITQKRNEVLLSL
jgi:malate synthase